MRGTVFPYVGGDTARKSCGSLMLTGRSRNGSRSRGLIIQDCQVLCFFGDQPYALAQAPPISIARSLLESRSAWRKGSTACS